MDIAIVGGTGDEGFGLALRLAKAGEHVIIGSRVGGAGQAAAAKADRDPRAGRQDRGNGKRGGRGRGRRRSRHRAVRRPGRHLSVDQGRVPAGRRRVRLHVSAGHRGGRPGLAGRSGRGRARRPSRPRRCSRQARPLVSGFQTVSGEELQELDRPLEGDVLLCGADAEAKATIGSPGGEDPEPAVGRCGRAVDGPDRRDVHRGLVSVNRAYGIHRTGIALTGRDGVGRAAAQPPKGDG